MSLFIFFFSFVWLSEEDLKCFSFFPLFLEHVLPEGIFLLFFFFFNRASQKQHDIDKDLTISCNLIKSRSSERHTFHDKKTLVYLRAKGTWWLDCNARQLPLKTKRQDCIFDKGRNLLSEKDSRQGSYV